MNVSTRRYLCSRSIANTKRQGAKPKKTQTWKGAALAHVRLADCFSTPGARKDAPINACVCERKKDEEKEQKVAYTHTSTHLHIHTGVDAHDTHNHLTKLSHTLMHTQNTNTYTHTTHKHIRTEEGSAKRAAATPAASNERRMSATHSYQTRVSDHIRPYQTRVSDHIRHCFVCAGFCKMIQLVDRSY